MELPDFNGIQDNKDYFDAVIDKMTTLLQSRPALYFLKRYQEQQLEVASENVDIMIYPADDMSASEYYDTQDILKQRFDILADGVDYEYAVRDDTIHVVIPQEVFHEMNPETSGCTGYAIRHRKNDRSGI